MRRRTALVWGGAAVAVVAVAAFVGPAVYAGIVNGHADPVPTLDPVVTGTSAGTSAGTAAGATPGATSGTDALADGTWTVTAGSFAGYRVHEVLQGHGATVTGRTDEVTGSVRVADGRVTSGTVTVQVADVHTDEPPRDAYFRSHALETGTFPTATFTLTSPVRAAAGGADLPGRLTIHGVTRDVSVPARVAATDGRAEVVASLPVAWADFGVTAPHLPFVRVDEAGSVELRLVLTP